jgi:hypothetical protein
MTLKTIKNTPPPSAAHPQLLSITPRAHVHAGRIKKRASGEALDSGVAMGPISYQIA